jgi:hypothetical protein
MIDLGLISASLIFAGKLYFLYIYDVDLISIFVSEL